MTIVDVVWNYSIQLNHWIYIKCAIYSQQDIPIDLEENIFHNQISWFCERQKFAKFMWISVAITHEPSNDMRCLFCFIGQWTAGANHQEHDKVLKSTQNRRRNDVGDDKFGWFHEFSDDFKVAKDVDELKALKCWKLFDNKILVYQTTDRYENQMERERRIDSLNSIT